MSPIPTGIARLAVLYIAMGVAGLSGLALLPLADSAAVYGFWLIALAVGAPAAGIGLLRRKPWARTLAMWVPALSIPLWMVPGAVVYVIVELVMNGMEGSHTNSPAALVAYAAVTSAIMLPFWLIASIPQWRLLRRRDVMETYHPNYSNGQLLKTTGLVLLASALILAYLPIPNRMLLHDASAHGWTGMVSILLHVGNSPNRKTRDGRTPLHFAAQFGRTDTVRYLVERGADVNARTAEGITPARLAAGLFPYYVGAYVDPSSDYAGSLIFLVEHGADLDGVAEAVLDHMEGYDARLVHALLDAGVPIDSKGESQGRTFLSAAVTADNVAEARYLVAHGSRLTPDLLFSAGPKTLDFLLSKGLSINTRNQYGDPLLHRYCFDSEIKMLKLVISRGADLQARNKEGKAALHVCLGELNPQPEAMEVLLDAGADPDVRDRSGQTPLFYCIEYGYSNLDAARILLRHGADINARDREGNTVLHKAAGEGDPESAGFLVSCQADGRIKNNEGKTPYQVAKDRKMNDWAQVTTILRQNGFAD